MTDFSFAEHAAGPQSREQTLLILTYEVQKVLQCEEDAELEGSVGYNGHALTELSDAISMIRYFCEQLSIDYLTLHAHATLSTNVVDKWVVAQQLPSRLSVYLGKVVQAYHYTNVFGSTLYHDRLVPSLANLVALCHRYCVAKGWQYIEVEQLGEEHYLERMEHIREKGVQVEQR